MKKLLMLFLALCCLMAGCGKAEPSAESTVPQTETTAAPETTVSETQAPTEPPVTVSPLPQGIDLNNLEDCTLPVSLAEGDAYVDDEGAMQMKVTVYTHDVYDAVEIAALSQGDTLVFCGQEVKIEELQQLDDGSLVINGSVTLRSYMGGTCYAVQENDHPVYYALGEAVIRVSPDFEFTDSAIPGEEKIFYPGDFLVDGTGIDYNFTPYNTTIRIENGKVIEMHRIYIP